MNWKIQNGIFGYDKYGNTYGGYVDVYGKS